MLKSTDSNPNALTFEAIKEIREIMEKNNINNTKKSPKDFIDGLVSLAEIFATSAHCGQKRKYTGEPYITHCKAVSETLLDYNNFRPEVIAAAYLHDTVEDTDVDLQWIADMFGYDMAGFVSMVTDVSDPSMGNRALKKAIDLEHFRRASSEGQSIKIADLLDNSKSIFEHYKKFFKVYLKEKENLVNSLDRNDPQLLSLAREKISHYKESMKEWNEHE